MTLESGNTMPSGETNWVSRRESAEFREGLQMLENVIGLDSKQKMFILAVTLGLKKAADIEFQRGVVHDAEFENIVTQLGLFFQKFTPNNMEDRFEHYYIGFSPDDIKEVSEADDATGVEGVTRCGKAMDYPETAVEALCNADNERGNYQAYLLDEDDPKLTDEEKAFQFFRFSKKSWKEEIAWLEQIIAGTKEYSPKIYNAIIEEYQSMKRSR